MEVPLWKMEAVSFNVRLLKEAGLTTDDFQLYMINCMQGIQGLLEGLSPTDTANALVGMMQYCWLFTANLPTDQLSWDVNQAINSWLLVHGPPMCVGNNLIDEGSEHPSEELQIISSMVEAMMTGGREPTAR